MKIGYGRPIAFTGTADAFSQNTLVGINDKPGGNIMDTFSSLPLYNLASNFSVTGDAINVVGSSFGTASGAFIIDNEDPTNSTFSATVTPAATPEPASLFLFANWLAGIAIGARFSPSARCKLRQT